MKRVLLFCAAASSAAFAQATAQHSATGSGRIQFGPNRESISFSAIQHQDGSVTGNAEVQDVSAGVTLHIDVDCLNVVGNVATISGIVTRSSEPTLEGFEGIFQVVDGGEGKGSVDLMSLANFFEVGVGPDCHAPGEFDLAPTESGNIQVR